MASPSWEWGDSTPSSRVDQTFFFSFWVCSIRENLKTTIIVLANEF
jgi:hypothetical protein